MSNNYMLADYCILVLCVATLSLIWRSILINHTSFALRVKAIPVVGESLYCGFCAPLWFALLAVLIYNPLAAWGPLSNLADDSKSLLSVLVGWLAAGSGVLLVRNTIAVLMELTAILAHKHQEYENR